MDFEIHGHSEILHMGILRFYGSHTGSLLTQESSLPNRFQIWHCGDSSFDSSQVSFVCRNVKCNSVKWYWNPVGSQTWNLLCKLDFCVKKWASVASVMGQIKKKLDWKSVQINGRSLQDVSVINKIHQTSESCFLIFITTLGYPVLFNISCTTCNECQAILDLKR